MLDQSSNNPTSHRATTVRTLTRRAQIICDSADSLRDENEHLRQIFHKNDYSDEFIDTNTYKQNKQNDECANTETKNELTTVSLPYIRGTSETIARILRPFNIRIAHKPTRTLRHLLTVHNPTEQIRQHRRCLRCRLRTTQKDLPRTRFQPLCVLGGCVGHHPSGGTQDCRNLS